MPLSDLCDHIVSAYHLPLRADLPRLEVLADKLLRVHGDTDGKRLKELREVLDALASELEVHMLKEERILFPLLRSEAFDRVATPMQVMEAEHVQATRMLARLRELTDDYTPPPNACRTWRVLWASLEELELTLREHMYVEHGILHPRARARLREMLE